MKLVYIAISLVALLGISIGLLGARQNILATVAAFESIDSQQGPDESEEMAANGSVIQTGPLTEEQYIASMSSVLQRLGDNTLVAYQLNEQAVEDPALLADNLWIEQVMQITSSFTSSSEIVRRTAVPASCQLSHEQMLSAVDYYDRCTELYFSAIDGGDTAQIEQCTVELQAGYLELQIAEQLLTDTLPQDGNAGVDNNVDTAFPFGEIPGAACIVTTDSNLRSGPGTTFDVVGGRSRGDMVYPVATNETGDWIQLDSGEWIAGWLLDETPTGLPVANF